MNKLYFSLLLSAITLTFAPACRKKSTPKKEIKTLIEVDNTVFEIENNEEKQ